MRKFLLALVALVGLSSAYAIATNYTMTQGAGTTFGSLVVSAVNYAQQLLCDPATPSQCAAVSAGGAVSVSVTNANANGSATSANSSPVVIASDQAAVATKAASGAIASGAIASGAVASGAFASGALASGSVASGAMVDLGAQADSACSTDNGSCSEIALTKRGNQRLTTLITNGSNDPCAAGVKVNVAIAMQNSTTIKLVSLASSQKIYICSLALIASGATVFSVADGTKSSTECDTAAEAVIGAAVASHGLSLAANGGISYGNGHGTVAFTTTAAHDLCLFQSGSVDLSGNITYVQQ